MIKFIFIFLLSLFSFCSFSQTITILTSKPKISLRGLSVVNDKVLWASGSNGTVARSPDGGKTFQWLTVTGYEQRDFRDIEAFDANTAIIMAIAEPAVILKTKDGGNTWKKVFEDTMKGMFLDAMDFNEKWGIVIGDPINAKMFIATTTDSGEHWNTTKHTIQLAKGEAFFASSGTNVKIDGVGKFDFRYIAVSGGTEADFIIGSSKRKSVYKNKLNLLQGKESQGANSIAVSNRKIVIVGGDFANDKDTTSNCVINNGTDKTWQHPQTPPHGYRSCVEFIGSNKLITCGTSGVDISNDGSNNWTLISTESFHVCQKAKQGTAVFLAGKDGRIAKLEE